MTDTGLSSSRPLRKDAVRNRQALVDAARTVFAHRGLDATLDDVAREAGVGVGTAYRHFANKRELAAAIMEESIDEVVAAAERALRADDPWKGLVDVLESALVLQTGDRGLREVLMSAKDAELAERLQARVTEPFARVLERAKAAGAVRSDVMPADFGLVISMLCAVAEFGGDTAPMLWRRYLALVLPGFRPDAPPLPGEALSEAEFRALARERYGPGADADRRLRFTT